MSDRNEKKSKPKGNKGSDPGPWLRVLIAGLIAVASVATAISADSHGGDVNGGNPAACVVVKAIP